MDGIQKQSSNSVDDATRCRLFYCLRSKWADLLAYPKPFIVIFSILTAAQGMIFFYYIGVITTVEKHFMLKSEALGSVLSFGELIPIIIIVIISYVSGYGDRPRWIAICLFLMGIGCYIASLPYFIFGTPANKNEPVNHSASSEKDSSISKLCISDGVNLLENSFTNKTENCEADPIQSYTAYIVGIYLLGYTFCTCGNVLLHVIGPTYIDDNVQQKNSPMYLALSFSMRSVSPLIGFILCSVCLSIYVNPLENTHLSPGDSQWIGAWWLGYIIIGTIAIIGGFFVGQFPKILPSHHQTPAMKMAIIVANNKENIPKEMNLFTKIYSSVKGLFPALRRLFTNILYLLRFSSGIISWFGMDGLVIFLPKYLENQFYLTQSEASLATGTAKVISLIVGFPCVGYIVHRLRPTCRQFTMALIVSKLIYSAFLLVLMGLFCTNSYVIGMNLSNNIPTCDVNCECSALPFTPVCGSDDRNYLSACYAGCSVVNSSISIQNPRIYENCSCISGGFTSDNFCGKNCSLYYVYVVILFIGNFLLSLNGLGEMILLLRSVSVEDKTVGLGVFHSTFSLLICLPAPLIFSALVDGACTLWSLSCRETGNCLLYDLDQLRYLLHAIPAALLIIGTIIDFLFWLKAKDVTLFGEEDDIKTDAYSEDS